MARRFFDSDEEFKDYIFREILSSMNWIDVLGREKYSKAYKRLEEQLFEKFRIKMVNKIPLQGE